LEAYTRPSRSGSERSVKLMLGFWDHFRSYKAAVPNSEAARVHLDQAAAFPPEQALPALAERARLRFRAGDLAACWTDLSSAISVLDKSPQARWVRNDVAFLGSVCRFAFGDPGADSLLDLIPREYPLLFERGLQGSTMTAIESRARHDSNLLIERYLA